MNDETAKELAAAMNRLAAAIEAVSYPGGGLSRGIIVNHCGLHQQIIPNLNWPYQVTSQGCGVSGGNN